MSIVCLDTNVIIWGIKKQSSPDQRHMINRAVQLIYNLQEHENKILIPSIVVGELLLNIDPVDFPIILEQLNNFMIAPYDQKAALSFAILWQSMKENSEIKRIRAEGKTKQELRADTMIVATAISNNAECIYSHDDDIVHCSNGSIPVYDLPDAALQGNLFTENS